ncbi:uncharacterized protein LOC109857288 isoform X2 [Pseudomyrmex gracilis]|uniref:uncharacterized protein LOC109857288 isoform X2 n=1 Tax=Pseudomyrmex gracilis TaxID=219809 RepID=UPI000994C80D|nr:uncharacterized protein LOC109857288 isoform X2 [Pseudomyrmex gracilis]
MELVERAILLNLPFLTCGIFNAVKSARAPRRLENVKDRRAMFHLDGRNGGTNTDVVVAATKYDDSSTSSSNEEENFDWWLMNDREITVSSRSRRRRTVHRSSSNDRRSFARNASKREPESGISEELELGSLTRDNDLDIDLIEKDAVETSDLPATDSSEGSIREESETRAACYTPERLIRSQKYRILVPSPRCFIFPRFVAENGSGERRFRHCRKRLSCLIDSKQIGATQLKMLLNLPIADARTRAVSSPIFGQERCNVVGDCNDNKPSNDDLHLGDKSARTISSRSSYDILNSTWDYDCKGLTVRPPSLDDTSGIQSTDWSLETQSDTRNTPMCLCDELAVALDRGTAINNKVASILESLRSDPENATALSKNEDRFRNEIPSFHDQLTRLTIETNGTTVSDDANNWLHRLRDKIKRLRLANKEIHRDIRDLCTDFQRDEEKTMNLSNSARHLLQDVCELRYLDDLLKLLKGEPDRISKRNWPFVLRHSEPHEELNLII